MSRESAPAVGKACLVTGAFFAHGEQGTRIMDLQGISTTRPRSSTAAGVTGAAVSPRIAKFQAAINGDSKTSAGGLTGTVPSAPVPVQPPKLPNADSVAADTKELAHDLTMLLAIGGIKSDPALAFEMRSDGDIIVVGDDPRAAAAKKMLDSEPSLKQRLTRLVGEAQSVEQDIAKDYFYEQTDAGISEKNARKRLAAAQQAIETATGFTLDSNAKLTVECTGIAKALMRGDAVQVSDEEKLWNEMVRLTDRTRRTGLAAAVEEAKARENEDSDRRITREKELGDEELKITQKA